MTIKSLAERKVRKALLNELAGYVSAELVEMAGEESTDAQIIAYIEGAKAQREARRRAGIRDLRKAEV
jgi:hypothetical protein